MSPNRPLPFLRLLKFRPLFLIVILVPFPLPDLLLLLMVLLVPLSLLDPPLSPLKSLLKLPVKLLMLRVPLPLNLPFLPLLPPPLLPLLLLMLRVPLPTSGKSDEVKTRMPRAI